MYIHIYIYIYTQVYMYTCLLWLFVYVHVSIIYEYLELTWAFDGCRWRWSQPIAPVRPATFLGRPGPKEIIGLFVFLEPDYVYSIYIYIYSVIPVSGLQLATTRVIRPSSWELHLKVTSPIGFFFGQGGILSGIFWGFYNRSCNPYENLWTI